MSKKHFIVQIVLTAFLAMILTVFLVIIPIRVFYYQSWYNLNFEKYGYQNLILSIILLIAILLIILLSVINLFLTVIKSKGQKIITFSIFGLGFVSLLSMGIYELISRVFLHKYYFVEATTFSVCFSFVLILTSYVLVSLFNSKPRSKKQIVIMMLVTSFVSHIFFALLTYYYYELILPQAFGKHGLFAIAIPFCLAGIIPLVTSIFFVQSFFKEKKHKIISTLISLIVVTPLFIIFVAPIIICFMNAVAVALIYSIVVLLFGWLLSPMYFLPFINKGAQDE